VVLDVVVMTPWPPPRLPNQSPWLLKTINPQSRPNRTRALVGRVETRNPAIVIASTRRNIACATGVANGSRRRARKIPNAWSYPPIARRFNASRSIVTPSHRRLDLPLARKPINRRLLLLLLNLNNPPTVKLMPMHPLLLYPWARLLKNLNHQPLNPLNPNSLNRPLLNNPLRQPPKPPAPVNPRNAPKA